MQKIKYKQHFQDQTTTYFFQYFLSATFKLQKKSNYRKTVNTRIEYFLRKKMFQRKFIDFFCNIKMHHKLMEAFNSTYLHINVLLTYFFLAEDKTDNGEQRN